MTNEETLKQALEALQECRRDPRLKYEHPTYDKAIKALEEALEQEQGEPVAWRETHGKVIKALAGIVNVHTPDNLFDLDAIPRDPVMALVQNIKFALDKYKPPQQRKPLTDEQFQAIRNNLFRQDGWDGDGWDLALKEAIEAAHGIKENT
jgi:hypothetical protein